MMCDDIKECVRVLVFSKPQMDFVFPLEEDEPLQRERDEIDELFTEYMREFNDCLDEQRGADDTYKMSAFGTLDTDMEIAYNMAKAIFVVHHVCGVEVRTLHTLLNPFNLTRCAVMNCDNRTCGMRFLCQDHTCAAASLSIEDTVSMYRCKLAYEIIQSSSRRN